MVSDELFFPITKIEQLQSLVTQVVGYSIPQKDQACLITLSGDLGAGKTTFTQELGAELGIADSINSPTYVIEQRYPIMNHDHFDTLVHIDAYRLEQEQDPQNIGLNETLLNPNNLVVIEWPEKIDGFLKNYKKLALSLLLEDNNRSAQVTENSL